VTGLHGVAFQSFVRTVDKSAPGRGLRVISVPLILPYELVPCATEEHDAAHGGVLPSAKRAAGRLEP